VKEGSSIAIPLAPPAVREESRTARDGGFRSWLR
jgi:hypothetical protein